MKTPTNLPQALQTAADPLQTQPVANPLREPGAPHAAQTAASPSSDAAVVPASATVASSVPGGVQLAGMEGAAATGSPAASISLLEPLPAGPHEMTLAQALQYAVQHHPRLRARRHEVQVARGKLVAAGVLPNPQLVLDLENPLSEDDGSEVTGRLMFTIPTADKLRLGKSVATAEIFRCQYALQRETQAVLLEVSTAGTDVLYYQELLSLQGRESELVAKQAALEQGRFQAQQVPAASAIAWELKAKEAELKRLETGSQLDTARLRLSRGIGLLTPLGGLSGRLEVEPLPAVSSTRLLEAAERNAPEINEARATLARSQRQLALERAKAVPDLQIGPRSQNRIGAEGRNPAIGARVAFDVPIFDRNQGAICESAAQTEADQALLEDVALTTLGNAAAVYEELRSLQARLKYFENQFLPLAERTEATIRENEVSRALPPNQLVDLMQEVLRIRFLHLALRYRYATIFRQLENMVGCRLSELDQVAPVAGGRRDGT